MAKDEKDMYELICRERFKELKEMQAETLRILKGEDTEPGLVDDVRGLKKSYKRIIGGGIFVLGAIILQAVRFIGDWLAGIFK
jgi:hypothetical protein